MYQYQFPLDYLTSKMQPGVQTFLRLAAMVRSILDEPQILLVVNLFDQVRRLHYGRTQANLICKYKLSFYGFPLTFYNGMNIFTHFKQKLPIHNVRL